MKNTNPNVTFAELLLITEKNRNEFKNMLPRALLARKNVLAYRESLAENEAEVIFGIGLSAVEKIRISSENFPKKCWERFIQITKRTTLYRFFVYYESEAFKPVLFKWK